jgi:hypothetical protein
MALVLLLFSLFSSPKTNPPSPLSPTLATLQRLVDVVEFSQEDVVNEAEESMPVVEEALSRELEVDEVARKDTATMIPAEVVVVPEEDDDSDGKITTSHKEIAMLLSTLSQTGRCWRRLTSTAWLS